MQAAGLGIGWTDGDHGRGPSYRFTDPDGHMFELYYECERYDPPEHLRPALKNVPGRYTGRGCAVKRLDHINLLAADVRANREFCVDALGYRLYERIELNDGSEAGAWMSATIAAHELIYTRDARGARGRLHHVGLLGRHPRGVHARRRHLARRRDRDRGGALQARDRPGLLPVRDRAGRQPRRGDHRRATSSTRPTSRASSGPRPSGPRDRPGACRPCRAFTPTAPPRWMSRRQADEGDRLDLDQHPRVDQARDLDHRHQRPELGEDARRGRGRPRRRARCR